ncbi:UBC-like protein [Pluteus cervinus]|uniref:UBC-like protein n=1 Tax=Pluteus cervinus TaxID=181527 RepID=A0ACD3BCX3_9AGAR|nr:UBC-like protein [Pluteus cervinus]
MLGGFVVTHDLNKSKPKPQPSTVPTAVTDVSAIAKTAIALEYASLRHKSHCPLGMYIVPSQGNLLHWDGVFFIHQGYYADAVLKFRLIFPPNYPNKPPAVYFVTDIFHPMISQNGDFNLIPRFRPWRPKEHHVFDVLHWIKAAFKKKALDGFQESECLNKEAYRYHESTSSFAALATQSSLLSLSPSALFDKDHPSMGGRTQGGFVFEEISPRVLQEGRKKLGIQPWEKGL